MSWPESGKENPDEIPGGDYLSALQPLIEGKKLAGIGSPRASLESNFALEKLVGKENFYHGISNDQFRLTRSAVQILKSSNVHSPSLKEVERADAVLILGEDLTNSAPMLALSVRQASRNISLGFADRIGIPSWNDAPVRELAQKTRSPLYIASPFATKLDDIAEERVIAAPVDIARLGFDVAAAIDPAAPKPPEKAKSRNNIAAKIANALISAENPIIITGLQNNELSLLHAASNIILALSRTGRKPSLSIIFPESNSLGLGLMDGKPLEDLVEMTGDNYGETLIILENNLYTRTTRRKVDSIFGKFENIIVLDHLMNETAMKADIVLPSGTFAESTGTIVNNEGRAQRYYRVLPDEGQVKESWKFLSEMANIGIKTDLKQTGFDDIVHFIY